MDIFAGEMTAGPFDLYRHDAVFQPRLGAAEWARITAFRELPGFLDAVRRHEGVMQPFFAHNLVLNRVVTEVWRFQILVFALYLHATRDPEDPRSGLTVANLQKICARMKLASAGRVFAFLNIMKLGGYLSAERSGRDSRVVHLIPTDRFMAIVEEWNGHIFDAVDLATRDGSLARHRAAHPLLGQHMRTSGAEGLLQGWDPLGPFPEVFHFAASDGGWLLIEHLVLRSIDAQGPITLNLRSAARQFGGSRSNLARVLESAHEQGLLEAPPRGGSRIELSARMIAAFLNFMASFLGYFRHHSAIALARIEAGIDWVPALP